MTEVTTETTETTEGQTGGSETTEQVLTMSQDKLNRIIDSRVAEVKAKYTPYEEKAKQFDALQEASKTDLEKVQSERDSLKSELDPAKAENTRLRVAIAKQLPLELIDRLKGSTKEELEADADELLKLVKPVTTPRFDGGKGRQQAATPSNDMNSFLRKAIGRE